MKSDLSTVAADSSPRPRRHDSGLFYSLVLIDIILAGFLFATLRSNGEENLALTPTTTSSTAPTASTSQTPQAIPSAQPSTPVETAPSSIESTQLELNFIYTSTGIELNWNGGSGVVSESTVIESSENGAGYITLATLADGENVFEIEKIDTVGMTKFRVTDRFADGSSSTNTIKVRGLFTK